MLTPTYVISENWDYTSTGGFTVNSPINSKRNWWDTNSGSLICKAANSYSGANSIQSNDTTGSLVGVYNDLVWPSGTFADMQEFCVFQFVTATTAPQFAILGRCVQIGGSDTYYQGLFDCNAGTVKLFAFVSGVSTQLGSTVSLGAAFPTATFMRAAIRCVGSHITVRLQRFDTKQWLSSAGTWVAGPFTTIFDLYDSSVTGTCVPAFQVAQGTGDLIAVDDFLFEWAQVGQIAPLSTANFSGYSSGTNVLNTMTDQGCPWIPHSTVFSGSLLIDNRSIGGTVVNTVYSSSTNGMCLLVSDGVQPGYDQDVQINLTIVTNTTSLPGIFVVGDPHRDNMYLFRYNYNSGTPRIELIIRNNGATTGTITTNLSSPLTPGNTYVLKMSRRIVTPGSSNTVIGSITGPDITTATAVTTDGTIKNTGFVGFRASGADTPTTGARMWGFQASYSPRTLEFGRTVATGYNVYRVPACVVTANYTVIAWEARLTATTTSNRDVMITLIPNDNAWLIDNPAILLNDGSNATSLINEWQGAAAIAMNMNFIWMPRVGTGPYGRIMGVYVRYTPTFNITNAVAGTSGNTGTIWVITSDNEGVSWSGPTNITVAVKTGTWGSLQTGSGNGLIYHSTGRIIGVLGFGVGTGNSTAGISSFYTDDGTSWFQGGIIKASSSGGATDASLAELADGSVMAAVRPNTGGSTILLYKSTDRGVTWSVYSPTVVVNNAQTAVGLISMGITPAGAGKGLLVQSYNNNTAGSRQDFTFTYSTDSGNTWSAATSPTTNSTPGGSKYATGGAGNSNIGLMADGTLVSWSEHGDGNNIQGELALAFISYAWLDVPAQSLPSSIVNMTYPPLNAVAVAIGY
jgi:sialidase-1